MNYALGHLPIELKVYLDTNKVGLTPIYFPDNQKSIFDKANHIYLCLEIEDVRHGFIRRNRVIYDNGTYCHRRKKLHTKFFGVYHFEINSSDFGTEYYTDLNNLYWYITHPNHGNKGTGYKFKIRGTYRYDSHKPNNYPIRYGRTHIFSNEVELQVPNNYNYETD